MSFVQSNDNMEMMTALSTAEHSTKDLTAKLATQEEQLKMLREQVRIVSRRNWLKFMTSLSKLVSLRFGTFEKGKSYRKGIKKNSGYVWILSLILLLLYYIGQHTRS